MTTSVVALHAGDLLTVRGNLLENANTGLLVEETGDVLISGNTIRFNEYGLVFESLEETALIHNNEIRENGTYGVWSLGNHENVIFWENNVYLGSGDETAVDDSVDAAMAEPNDIAWYWDDTNTGNFWSDYAAKSAADGLGRGDIADCTGSGPDPYPIENSSGVVVEYDCYPLASPVSISSTDAGTTVRVVGVSGATPTPTPTLPTAPATTPTPSPPGRGVPEQEPTPGPTATPRLRVPAPTPTPVPPGG